MRSMQQALIWETYARGRWWILGLFMAGNLMPMLVLGALGPYEIDPADTAFLLLHIVFLPLIMVSFGGGVLAGLGPLSRMYTRPISTSAIVAWQLIPGGILLAIEITVASWMYRIIYHVNWPILGPSLFAIVAWASMQLLTSVSHKSITSFMLAASPSVVIFGWFHARYGGWFTQPTHYWTDLTPIEFLTMAGVITLSYFLTVAAVERDRCGEPLPSLGGWKWIVKTWESFRSSGTIEARPFSSALDAHSWYEWRLKGWAMPLIVTLAYLVVGSVWCLQVIFGEYVGNAVADFREIDIAGGAMIPGVAGIVGLLIGIASTGNANRNHSPTISDLFDQKNAEEMGHFLSTRPFTNTDFASSFVRMVLRSLLISWLIWATTFVVWLFVADLMHQLPNSVFPDPIRAWYLPLVILGSWGTMANLATIGLSGRGTRLTLSIVSGFFVYMISTIVIKSQCSEATQEFLFRASIWIACLGILLATPIALRSAVQRRLLSKKLVRRAAPIVTSMATAVFILEADRLSIIAYPLISAFAALLILPLATIPLAISWNRHR